MLNPNLPPIEEPALPWYLQAMEAYPTMTASAMVKTHRGSGTIIGGGWRDNRTLFNRSRRVSPGITREGFRQANYLNPRNWNRFAEQRYFHGRGAIIPPGTSKLTGEHYNPFYMAAAANAVGRGFLGEADGKLGRTLNKLSNTGLASRLREAELIADGEDVMARGVVSRVSASQKVMGMSNAKFGRKAGSIYGFLEGAGYSASEVDSIFSRGAKGAPSVQRKAASALAMSGGGTISGIATGYIDRTRGLIPETTKMTAANVRGVTAAADDLARLGMDASRKATLRSVGGHTISAAAKAGDWATRLKTVGSGARLGLGIGARVGSRFLGPIGVALLVGDVAKLGTKAVGGAIGMGIDAKKSFEGGLNKGIMQGNFRDNEATMTSRARGVHAIQNSRLNARSILGSEAGAMYSHFG